MEIICFDEIESTNDHMKDLKDKKDWLVIRAKKQSKGRGRRGKEWHSEEGGALFTINLNKDKYIADEFYDKLPLLAGLAVLKALDETYRSEYKIKWPNDVYVYDKKISGILVEKVELGYIIGVGVNINLDKFGDYSEIASSLKLISGKNYDIDTFVRKVVLNMKDLYYSYIKGEWKLILNEINSFNYLKGKEVKICDGQKDIIGRVEDLDESGGLSVLVDGDIEIVTVGDIKIIENVII